jgi:hypothetical protein
MARCFASTNCFAIFLESYEGMPQGSGTNGRRVTSDSAAARCNDWTSTAANGRPWCGHSWPRQGSGTHWIHSIQEGGCGAGINLAENPPQGNGTATVGAGGGYGGIYCFALTA